MNPYTLSKNLRALEIARVNRLPVVNLVESGGADLPTQADLFVPAGQIFHDLTQLSAWASRRSRSCSATPRPAGRYVPGMCDYAVMVDQRAKVFLGGPPLVKMATGEESDDEELGGAAMHSRVSGLSDYFARDELDCIRIGRQIVADLNWRKLGPAPAAPPTSPLDDPDELLGIVSVDLRVPFDPREVLARVVDGSRFDEYKAAYGTSLVTGWASIHGYPVGVLANAQGVLFMDEAKKATEFILLANQTDTPLVFLQNTTGYMVGKDYEQAGIIKDGAKMINAVTNSTVPHLTVIMGASYGAGNYGMCGRAYGPRFLFAWPNAKMAVMGPQQLAGVLSIVARQSAESAGRPFDEEADAVQRQAVEDADRARVARRSSTPGSSTTTASSTPATPAPCSASRCRLCTPTSSRAAAASACSGCSRRCLRSAGCSSPTAVRSPAASSAPRGPWASRPSRSSPTPTRTHRSSRSPTRPSTCPGARRATPTSTSATSWPPPRRTGADAVHPGYGFLSENAAFARACAAAGLTFVGPPPEAIEAMGSKIGGQGADGRRGRARPPRRHRRPQTVRSGRRGRGAIGFPLLVKAAFGGGGRGMRVARSTPELDEAVGSATREAAAAFGDGTVFLERFVESPRHVEVQIFADTHGTVVHLFERECSIQRRHQKIIEESPVARR